jgi:hypothetical protein
MKNTIKKFILMFLFSVCLLPAFSVGVYASDTAISTTPIGTVSTSNQNTSTQTNGAVNIAQVESEVMPKTTIDQAKVWATRKGNDLVSLLQTIVQPLAVIVFIISAFVAMFGVFGHGGVTMKGIIGMAIAVVMYTGVLFAPEIIQFTSGWLAS